MQNEPNWQLGDKKCNFVSVMEHLYSTLNYSGIDSIIVIYINQNDFRQYTFLLLFRDNFHKRKQEVRCGKSVFICCASDFYLCLQMYGRPKMRILTNL